MHLITAPSNLGLKPLREGHIPGTWRAPQVLKARGLDAAIRPDTTTELARPVYSAEEQTGTRLRNGVEMRRFNLEVAATVGAVIAQKDFPLVVGGDCSILLGCLAGARLMSPVSLVHIDGHSDFRHPGNYDADAVLGAVAGMDLALATGRGESIMTDWPDVDGPLVPDRQVVQLGERESKDPGHAWPDIFDTDITLIDVFDARKTGPDRIVSRIGEVVEQEPTWPCWIHLDVDAFDQEIMPAVDSPGSPGLDPDLVIQVCRTLIDRNSCCGMSLAIYDPDLDPDGKAADLIVEIIAKIFG